MANLTTIAVASLVALQSAASAQFTDAEIGSALVMMSREGHCGFGYEDRTDIRQCPSYTVGLAGDGTVTYVGSNGVKTLGIRTHKASAVAARALVEEFLRARFFDFNDSYRSISFGGMVTTRDHAVGTTLTLSIGARSISLYAFFSVPYATPSTV